MRKMIGQQQTTTYSSLDLLSRIPLFAGLNEAELGGLAQDFTLRQFQPGETIFFEGDAGQTLYLIESGQVRIYVQNEEGQETSVALYGPGDLLGELAVIDQQPRSATAVALKQSIVYAIGRDRFHYWLRESPQLLDNFLKMLTVRIRLTTRQVGDLTFLDVPARLARKLLELAQVYGRVQDGSALIDAPLTQSDLASLTGATRESVNKALAAFRRQGLIRIHQGQIAILDTAALRQQT
jgi:CRP/FNR family transcriptional regulator, cyclic AMP receptor protein